MAGLNTTNNFQVNISTQEDSSQNVPINRGVNVSFDSNFAEGFLYNKITGATNLLTGIGFTPAYQVYIRNMDQTSDVTVTLTPTGGAAVLSMTLKPGATDFLLLVNKTAGAANAGFTAVSVAPVGASALIEYFIGG